MAAPQPLRAALSVSAYPLTLVATVAAAAALLERGAPAAVVSTAAILAVLALTAILERLSPHVPAWNEAAAADVRTDAAYLATAWIPQAAARALGQAVAVLLTLGLGAWLGPKPWPPGWPLWTQILLAVLVADLGKYWLHRLSHERAALWRFHAAHHSPGRMYSLNGLRLHPVNMLWNLALDVGVPLLLGLQGSAVVLAGVFRSTVSLLQHANVSLRLGPLNWIFSTPALHQWHHSRVLAEGNTNYGSTFILWDVLFGTRFLPAQRTAPEALGLAGGAVHPRRFLSQLLWPFCEKRAQTCRLGPLS